MRISIPLVIDRVAEWACVSMSFPIAVLARLQELWVYVFVFTAPLWPMPEYFSIAGVPPVTVIALLLLITTPLSAIAANSMGRNIEKIVQISPVIFIFLSMLLVDIYWLIFGDFNTEIKYVSAHLITYLFTIIIFISIYDTNKLISIMRVTFFSINMLAVIAIISSIFGIGKLRAARSVGGMTIPFAKSVGIPMSDGEFGIIMTFAIPFILANCLGKIKIFKKKYIPVGILILTLFATLLISQSRSGWLALTVCLATYFVTSWSRNIPLMMILISSALIFIITAGNFVFNIFAGTSVYYNNVFIRFDQWAVSFEIIAKNWLIGCGHDYFQQNYFQHNVLHNNFLFQFVSGGIIQFTGNLLIYIYLIIGLLKNIHKSPLCPCAIAGLMGAIVELIFYQGFFVEVLPIEMAFSLYLIHHTMNGKNILNEKQQHNPYLRMA